MQKIASKWSSLEKTFFGPTFNRNRFSTPQVVGHDHLKYAKAPASESQGFCFLTESQIPAHHRRCFFVPKTVAHGTFADQYVSMVGTLDITMERKMEKNVTSPSMIPFARLIH